MAEQASATLTRPWQGWLGGLNRAIAAGFLGRVERAVGAAQEARGVVAGLADRPAGRAGHAQRRGGAQALDARGRVLVAGQQDAELVAAEAGERVAGPEQAAPGARSGAQDGVAVLVAAAV